MLQRRFPGCDHEHQDHWHADDVIYHRLSPRAGEPRLLPRLERLYVAIEVEVPSSGFVDDHDVDGNCIEALRYGEAIEAMGNRGVGIFARLVGKRSWE